MRVRLMLVAAALVLAALAAVPSRALATPMGDFTAVFGDWRGDADVSSCRFTRAQLVNARAVASSNADFDTYSPGFREEVGREIARHDSGGCRGVSPPPSSAKRAASPLRSVRIARIRPKGTGAESVTIRNAGRATVNLGRSSLRDRSGRRARIPADVKLGGGRSLTVITGCAPGKSKPVRRGAKLFACLSKALWDDRGDVVKVVDARGTVVAQRGYGTFKRVARF